MNLDLMIGMGFKVNQYNEAELIELAARWEAMCAILDGEEVSDLMLSFPEVRQLYDIMNNEGKTK